MTLTTRLHCPSCQGRLSTVAGEGLRCLACNRAIRVQNGIADLVADVLPLTEDADRYTGLSREDGYLGADLPARIRLAAGARWPVSFGDVIEYGCGIGMMTQALANEAIRGLLVLDTDMGMLRAAQARVHGHDFGLVSTRPVFFATTGAGQDVVRDTVADTVFSAATLTSVGDVRAFLTTVHRILRPGGRAFFVVPNRRYFHALCLAMAEALTQRFTRDGQWPDGAVPTMTFFAQKRRLVLHPSGDTGLHGWEERHLFDSDALEDMGREIGYATAEAIPLDPDPAGGETLRRICLDAGAPEQFAREIAPLAASTGHQFLSLLGHRDSSAFNLFWLTKAPGPAIRLFSATPPAPPVAYTGADTALGGVKPRWSIELTATDTDDGVVVEVGGWCLSNIDAEWVRIMLDGVAHDTAVWRYRPDVHEVLNRQRHYHPLNALCSGLEGRLLFAGVHARPGGCDLQVAIVLAGGITVTGPAPERLMMDEFVVIAH